MRARLALVLVLLAPLPLAEAEPAEDVQRALSWLAARAITPDVAPYYVEVAAQVGLDAKRWPSPDASAFAALGDYGQADPTTAYNARLRIAYAVATAGYDPRDVHGVDRLAQVRAGFAGAQFGNPATFNDDAWAILALRAAGVPKDDDEIRAAVLVLRSAQRLDGGWAFNAGAVTSDTDVTGMVLAALRSAGEPMADFGAAAAFLDSTRAASGGHASAQGGVATAESTVWAIVGYAALGRGPGAGAEEYLHAMQRNDGGFAHLTNGGSNLRATLDVVPWLVGALHPFAGFAPARIRAPPAPHALEPLALAVEPPFTRLSVSWSTGAEGAFDPPEAGTYAYRYHATGPGVTARGEGSIDVLSARPLLGAFPPEVRLARRAPLALDLRNATDPDGRIVAFEVDWGDGNVTDASPHAYERPGRYEIRVRARDDAGVWSAPAGLAAVVENRAPALAAPVRVVADRTRALPLEIAASDPEGDAVSISWSYRGREGAGVPSFVPETLGNATLAIVATDPYGATARANVTVEVVNLPPTLTLDGPGLARASDPDGPAPVVAWWIEGEPATPPFDPPPGTWRIRAVATDADGATAEVISTLVVAEPEPEAPAPVAPRIVAFDVAFEGDSLHASFVVEPPAAVARLLWESDVGEGERAATVSPLAVPLAGAAWARATLVVEHDGFEARGSSGLLLAPPPPESAPETPAAPPPAVVVDLARAPEPERAPPAEPRAPAEPLEATGVTLPASQRQETPAPLALIALLLAMLGRRGRSA